MTEANGRPVRCPSEDDLYDRLDLPFIAPELRAGDDGNRVGRTQRDSRARARATHPRRSAHAHALERRPRQRRTRWCSPPGSSDTSTWRSPTTRSVPGRAASCRSMTCRGSARKSSRFAARSQASRSCTASKSTSWPTAASISTTTMLEGFDIVLASLHDACDQDGVAAHRPVPESDSSSARQRHHASRESIAGAVTAASTSTSMRCSRQPRKPGRRWKSTERPAISTWTARSRGGPPRPASRSTIDSDCHRAEWLARQMRFGVGTARRGWIEPRHVLNARSVDDVRAFVARKRSRGLAAIAGLRGPRSDPSPSPASSQRSPSGRTRRRCCPASISVTPEDFQAAVLSPEVSARQAYPLYYRLARPFVATRERRQIPRAASICSPPSLAPSPSGFSYLCAR